MFLCWLLRKQRKRTELVNWKTVFKCCTGDILHFTSVDEPWFYRCYTWLNAVCKNQLVYHMLRMPADISTLALYRWTPEWYIKWDKPKTKWRRFSWPSDSNLCNADIKISDLKGAEKEEITVTDKYVISNTRYFKRHLSSFFCNNMAKMF